MHFFVDYIEPFTAWLQTNPKSAFFIIFLISFAESLAIVGSIVPGSLTMTAIGMLAGSGVVRIDLTLIFAIFGAVFGDGASYGLGYFYRDRLTQIWPFVKYPSLIFYGKDFFLKHGGKSVVIGRFIGPLRSIIPVIAGIMNMPKLLFFFANFISAIGWSLLYIMPGYLVGAASHQLSPEGARRLFIIIIVSLLISWVTSKLIHLAIRSLNNWYNKNLDKIYNWLIKYPYLKILFREENTKKRINGVTVSLVFSWIISLICAIIISAIVLKNSWVNDINGATAFFLQGIRSQYLDIAFVIINLFTSPIPLLSTFSIFLLATLIARDLRLFKYLVSLAFSSIFVVYIISLLIDVPAITNVYELYIDATFPVISLTWATALFSFLIYYIIEFNRRDIPYYLLRIVLFIILCLSGLSSIYLGDNWLFTVLASYFIGSNLGIIHWLFYQRKRIIKHKINLTVCIALFALTCLTFIEYYIHGDTILKNHKIELSHHKISKKDWWQQQEPILPLYSTDRIGNKIGIFNIQYLGSIRELEHNLNHNGWNKKISSVFYSLMVRIDGKHSDTKLPIMEQLYLNKRPELIMVNNSNDSGNFYILRLWRSNYQITNSKYPLWIGSIILATDLENAIPKEDPEYMNENYLFKPLLESIKKYKILDVIIHQHHQSLSKITNPKLLLFELDNSDK